MLLLAVIIFVGGCVNEPRIERRGGLAYEFWFHVAPGKEQEFISSAAHAAELLGLGYYRDSATELAIDSSGGAYLVHIVEKVGDLNVLVSQITNINYPGQFVVQVYEGASIDDTSDVFYVQIKSIAERYSRPGTEIKITVLSGERI